MTLETPYPYQITGAKWLATMPQALLADDMGLGKSAQVVHACDLLNLDRILILCPSSVRVNWLREFEKFSPMSRPCTVLFSSSDPIPDKGILICPYDLLPVPSTKKAQARVEIDGSPEAEARLKQARKTQAARRDFMQKLKSYQWDLIVLDEAHYLKERSAHRTSAVYGRGRFPGLMHQAKRCWRLTGTPAPNDASELYTHLLSANVIREPYWDFVFRFCSGFQGDYGFKITGVKNAPELKRLLNQFMLRRTKGEVMPELPEIRFQTVIVDRSPVELDPDFYEACYGKTTDQFYEELKVDDTTLRSALEKVSANHDKPNEYRAKMLESMSSSYTTLRRYIGMAKLPNCLEILEDDLITNPKTKIVIFAVHQCVIEATRARLRKYHAVTLYGKTPANKRQYNIDRFVKDPSCRVFIGNIQAAGVGIDGLQRVSNEVAFLEQDWVPAANAQAAMRVHRNGQEYPVRVRIFSLYKSVDEQVQDTLTKKTRELCKIF